MAFGTGFFNNYPGTDLHEIDLHYILMQLLKMREDMQTVIESNAITFADPINWDITSQYPANTVVLNSTGDGYISRKPVPAGIALTNTSYWTQIFSFNDVADRIRAGVAHNNGNSGTATAALSKDDLVWWQGDIYKVRYNIAAGTQLIIGTNVDRYTVNRRIADISGTVSDMQDQVSENTSDISQLQTGLQNEVTAREAAITAEQTARADAITAEHTAMEQAVSAEASARTAAITAERNARIAADQDLESQISASTGDGIGGALRNKTVIVLGDSLTIGSGSALGHTWVENLATMYDAIPYNYGVSGSKISTGGTSGSTPDDMATRINAILQNHNTCDYFVLSGGANDKNDNVPIGSINATAANTFIGAIKSIINKVRLKYGGTCKILLMTTYHRYDAYNSIGKCEMDYVNAMIEAGNFWSIPVFNNYNNCGIALNHPSSYPEADKWADIHYADGTGNQGHFSAEAYEYLTPVYAHFIVNGANTNTGIALNYQNVSGTLYNKMLFPNGMVLIGFRSSFSDVALNGGEFGGNNYSQDITITIPDRFKVNTPIVTANVYGVAGIGQCVIRAVSQDANSNITSITYRVTRVGASAEATATGFFAGTIIGFRAN